MRGVLVALVTVLLVVAHIPLGLSSTPSTVPAFLWSSHQYESSSPIGMKETVNYRTIAAKDLAKVVLSEGGWSNLLCSVKNQQSLDVAIIFIGRELQSSDVSKSIHTDVALVHLLKDSFTKSNFSMAIPYVAVSEEKGTLENSLISGFTESCGSGIGLKNIAFLGSCSVEGEDLTKLADIHAVHEYLSTRMESKPKGQTDVIMFCKGDSSEELDQTQSEGKIFSELISSVEQSGATYTVLYASDPYRPQYPSYRELDRFLAEGNHGNVSVNATFCDGVCQIKSSLLEGLLVIINNGSAYSVDGDVYFSVDKFPDYGRLSGRKLEDNRAGERVAVDSRKQNPADFALWKSAKEGEPFWESPWGPGRPGWHIECSAMSAAYLGYSFDIHGGGMDLVFPHHENEIAQSCAACNKSNISYWIHNGFVTIDSEKMSKSLGNFFTIRQVIDLYHPLALRLFLMGTHYRSPINYSTAQLESASDRLFYIYQTLHDCEELLHQNHVAVQDSIPIDTAECINKFRDEFKACMSDDLHTSVVLAAVSDPLKTINDLLHTRKGKKQESRIESISALEKEIKSVLDILGLMPTGYSEVLQQLKEKALKRAKLTEAEVLQKIQERNSARKNKEYEKSDTIRKDLASVGIALMDGPDGTTWRPTVPLALQDQVVSA